MNFINTFKYIGGKTTKNAKYSLYLDELLQTSCLSPFGPAELFKFVPDELVRKNLTASASRSCVALPPTIPVGDLGRSRLNHSYGYASAGDPPTLFAIFPLNFVPFMQYAG